MKVAIVIATYWRKNNSSKQKLERMFSNLKSQTYKNFKVFIVGDNYTKEKEFFDLCQDYKTPNTPIYYSNNDTSCRDNIFKNNYISPITFVIYLRL